MEKEWSCYRGVQFHGGRMVMLQRWSVLRRENDHVREVLTLMEGEWSCYRVCQLKEGEWSCYGGCHFNRGRKVMRVRGGQLNGRRIV